MNQQFSPESLSSALPLLDPELLKTFLAIAETGSFATASRVVFRTPSAVSMQIKRLEELLGRPVLKRDSRSVSLTEGGEMLVVYARKLLALNQELVSKFIDPQISGTVRIGSSDDFGERVLPSVLKLFNRSHPSVVVDVVIDVSVELLRRFEEGAIDIALTTCEPGKRPSGGESLFGEELVWAGARGGSAHLCRPIPLSVWEEGCSWRNKALAALQETDVDFRIAYMSAYTTGQRAAIRSDLAIAPLPRSIVDGDLVELGVKEGLPEIGSYELFMLVNDAGGDPVKAAADYMRQAFSA